MTKFKYGDIVKLTENYMIDHAHSYDYKDMRLMYVVNTDADSFSALHVVVPGTPPSEEVGDTSGGFGPDAFEVCDD